MRRTCATTYHHTGIAGILCLHSDEVIKYVNRVASRNWAGDLEKVLYAYNVKVFYHPSPLALIFH